MGRIIHMLFGAGRYLGRVFVPYRFREQQLESAARGAVDRAADRAAERWRRFWAIVRWTLHILLLIAVCVGLWYLNDVYDLERILSGPSAFLRQFWLPTLFLIFYVLCWLGMWLWHLLGPERETREHPDILSAWAEAVRSLRLSGIDIEGVPLFLVIGRPRDGEELLFSPARLHFPVRAVPHTRDSPLRIYANREAIYVNCSLESLLGVPVETEVEAHAGEMEPLPELVTEGEVKTELAAAARGSGLVEVPPSGGEMQAAGAVQSEMSPMLETVEEVEEVAEEAEELFDDRPMRPAQVELAEDVKEQRTAARIGRKPEETERLMRRLKYLCGLVARARRPYCPVNGVLLATPIASTASDPAANLAASDAHRFLQVIRETMQVQCPVFVVFCDMERLPGFRELIALLPEKQRQRLLGQRFPLAPDVAAGATPAMLQDGIRWFVHDHLPALVYRLMRTEPLNGDGQIDASDVNRRLYELLHALWEREHRINHIVVRAAAAQGEGPLLLGGCYFAATGPDQVREQAFIPGAFGHLVESQDAVAWTAGARAEDASYRRWTIYGYTGIAVFVASLGVAAYLVYSNK